MNKAGLIDAMAKEAMLSKTNTKKALDTLLEITVEALKNNEHVTLIGFGSFVVVRQKERKGKSSQVGVTIKKKVVAFKASSDLLEKIGDETNDTGPRKNSHETKRI